MLECANVSDAIIQANTIIRALYYCSSAILYTVYSSTLYVPEYLSNLLVRLTIAVDPVDLDPKQ